MVPACTPSRYIFLIRKQKEVCLQVGTGLTGMIECDRVQWARVPGSESDRKMHTFARSTKGSKEWTHEFSAVAARVICTYLVVCIAVESKNASSDHSIDPHQRRSMHQHSSLKSKVRRPHSSKSFCDCERARV